MSNRRLRRWASTTSRVAIGSAVAAAAVVGVVVGLAAPWPEFSAEPVTVEATPTASDTVLACAGPVLALGRTVEDAAAASVAASGDLVSGPDEAVPTLSQLQSDVDGAEVAVVSAAPTGSSPTAIAAGSSAQLSDEDLVGFAASACRPALMDSWLVGGRTTTGANDLVVLSNPGDVAATVQLQVYGAEGFSEPPGGADIVVAAGSQRIVPLAGLLLGEESPVVRVISSGAPVAASLQSSITRILVPGGVDQVSPVTSAGTQQVIPGVAVQATSDSDGATNASTSLRVLAPGATVDAEVSVLSADGGIVSTSTVPLVADVPSELDLSALDSGLYTIVVAATEPVVAAAWSTTGFGEGADFAWFAAAPSIADTAVVAVPGGPSPQLTIANPGTATATVEVSRGADVQSVEIAPGASADVAVSSGAVYSVTSDVEVSAAVSYADGDSLAGFPVWPADAAAPPITVFPG